MENSSESASSDTHSGSVARECGEGVVDGAPKEKCWRSWWVYISDWLRKTDLASRDEVRGGGLRAVGAWLSRECDDALYTAVRSGWAQRQNRDALRGICWDNAFFGRLCGLLL